MVVGFLARVLQNTWSTVESMTNTPFSSLPDYIALPRIENLALSPDGSRVILTVATLGPDKTAYRRALWSVAADGTDGATRLTRSAKGESGVGFTGSGDILFVSARQDGEADEDTEVAQVWVLPAAGGEARAITRLAGGAGGIAATARRSDTVVIAADLLPGASDLEADAAVRKLRKDKKVAAILHETYPVRYWDQDLGPDESHLLALDLAGLADTIAVAASEQDEAGKDEAEKDDADASTPYPPELPRPRDLTPHPARSIDNSSQALTPDGRTLLVSVKVQEARAGRQAIVSIDLETGNQTTLFDEPEVYFVEPRISNDGTTIAFVREKYSTPQGCADEELWVADLDGGNARRLASDWDRWPSDVAFDFDDAALIVTADDNGRAPIFRIPLDGGPIVRLTTDDFAYDHVVVDAATGDLVALRSSWVTPPHPVRVARGGTVTVLASPVALPEVPGTITDVETTAEDGARVRGWLLLPDGASSAHPAPFLLWIHGGPLGSWNAWSWRWSPLLALAQGYAVLLPDPALSTGYGLEFIQRGWDSWGKKPFTDLMSITDLVVSREDIDETRTAAMGGSFGGYMANWVAGHTDRFRAIVTHASLWALDQFSGTTDGSEYWQSIFSEQGMIDNSPHLSVGRIVTPMLVIHGDHDYRVPIGEGLRLWSDLAKHFAADDGMMQHKFLYFPDENHWILKPQHAVIWYETVFAFLATHVLDREWERPQLLG